MLTKLVMSADPLTLLDSRRWSQNTADFQETNIEVWSLSPNAIPIPPIA